MYKFKHAVFPVLILLSVLLTVSATATEITVDPTTNFCFSSDDFTDTESDDGIFITAIPSSNIASVYYGERILKAGDALTADALDNLTLETSCVTAQTAAIEYCTISDGKITGIKSLKMSIRPKSNEVPRAENGSFETYKNIENTGKLTASDPEGSILTYQLHDAPKRGDVEIHQDGSFTYKPHKNKVGKDSFTFTVTDNAGNTSSPARITIEILKPTDKQVYADMTHDPDQFAALWLKETGIFSGSTIGENLCFSPENTVTRGEFLVMAMRLVGADNKLVSMTSGFADEASTPVWMQPYIATALSNGIISGINSDDGIIFQPAEAMTKAESVVMLQNILKLPNNETSPVFAADEKDTIPVWAADAFYALTSAGLDVSLTSEDDILTRRDAANILYDTHILLEKDAASSLYWLE